MSPQRRIWLPWHFGCCARVEAGVWTVCCGECSGTGVWPVPWIDTVDQGLTDMENCACITCKGTGRIEVTLAAADTPGLRPSAKRVYGSRIAG